MNPIKEALQQLWGWVKNQIDTMMTWVKDGTQAAAVQASGRLKLLVIKAVLYLKQAWQVIVKAAMIGADAAVHLSFPEFIAVAGGSVLLHDLAVIVLSSFGWLGGLMLSLVMIMMIMLLLSYVIVTARGGGNHDDGGNSVPDPSPNGEAARRHSRRPGHQPSGSAA